MVRQFIHPACRRYAPAVLLSRPSQRLSHRGATLGRNRCRWGAPERRWDTAGHRKYHRRREQRSDQRACCVIWRF